MTDDLESLRKDITEQLGDETDYIKFDYAEGRFILSLIERVEKAEEARQGNNELHRLRSAGEKILENHIRELEAENENLRKRLSNCTRAQHAIYNADNVPGHEAPLFDDCTHELCVLDRLALSTTKKGKSPQEDSRPEGGGT